MFATTVRRGTPPINRSLKVYFFCAPFTASPGGKLSSVARLKRNAGGNVRQVPKFVPFPVLDIGIGTQFVLCRSASPAFLIRPFGAPASRQAPRGKGYKCADIPSNSDLYGDCGCPTHPLQAPPRLVKEGFSRARRVKQTCQWHVCSQSGK